MRVGFDISQLAHRGGVNIYTDHLSKELVKDNNLEMVFFYSSLRKPYRGSLPNVKTFKLPPTLFEIMFNRTRLVSIESLIGHIDIFHSSDWTQPPTKAKKVTTYHDLVPLLYPGWSDPKIVEVQKRRLKIVEKEIDMVIAVSNSTKEDLMKVSTIPSEKITVIYEGVDTIFVRGKDNEIKAFKQKYNLADKFILAISGVGERRNLARVKEAAKGYNLVVAGETLPWLDYKELPLLYSAASILVYPSFYEGFGLPILEAMSCGTPVITSNVSSMPEVGGDAALYVDPNNTEEIKNKIDLLIKDTQLQKELVKKGLIQAAKFSWEKCAKETARVYQELGR